MAEILAVPAYKTASKSLTLQVHDDLMRHGVTQRLSRWCFANTLVAGGVLQTEIAGSVHRLVR